MMQKEEEEEESLFCVYVVESTRNINRDVGDMMKSEEGYGCVLSEANPEIELLLEDDLRVVVG